MLKIWSLVMVAFCSLLFQNATAKLPSGHPLDMFPDTTHILAKFDERDPIGSFGSDIEHRRFQMDMLLSAYYMSKIKESFFKVYVMETARNPHQDNIDKETNTLEKMSNAFDDGRNDAWNRLQNPDDMKILQEYGLPQVDDEEIKYMTHTFFTTLGEPNLPSSAESFQAKLKFLLLKAMDPENWSNEDYRAFVPEVFYNIRIEMRGQEPTRPTKKIIDLLLDHERVRTNMFSPAGIYTVFSFVKHLHSDDGGSSSGSWD